MFKFVVIAALVACVSADAPTSYARGQPLGLAEYNAPSGGGNTFDIGSSGGSYDDSGSEGANLDSGLIQQISQILSSSSGSSGGSQSYSAPAPAYNAPSQQYGSPSRNGGGYQQSRQSGGSIQLGRIEVAQRVAEFDLSGGGHQNVRSNYGAPSGGY